MKSIKSCRQCRDDCKKKHKEEEEEEKTKEKKKEKKKKEKNPEDKNDPAKLKLKLKLEKLDEKMQALAAKREEIVKLLAEAEQAPQSSASS